MIAEWVCILALHSDSRPGIMARVAHVFSERGINLAEVLATNWRGTPTIVLKFCASQRLRDYLCRRLERMREVHAVRVRPGDARHVWSFLKAAGDFPGEPAADGERAG